MILLVWAFTFFGSDIQKIDTVGLQEIEVISPAYERFGQGQKSIKWSQKDLEAYQSRSLADLLADQSPVFIRSYGPGMLASPSFRGSSAGHTAVFWNGIPLNSPSLGQSDFSLLPVFAIDQASLQFGSSGALLGNEAIGGSVNLKSQAGFQE
nr:cobalamin receptor [Algoriphagus sp.]